MDGVRTYPAVHLNVLGQLVWHEHEYETACETCAAGRSARAAYQFESGCACNFGWEKVGQPCSLCERGQRLAESLDRATAELTQAQLNKYFDGAGLSGAMLDLTFQNFQVDGPLITPIESEHLKAALAAVEEACEAGRSIVLIGEPGIGKSHLAIGYLIRSMQQGRAGVYVAMGELLDSLRASYAQDRDGFSAEQVMRRYLTAPVLVADDLLQQKISEWVAEQIYKLLETRIRNGLTTVFTTNYSPADMAARFDGTVDRYRRDAILSRLEKFELIAYEAGDWRAKTNGQG